MASLLAKIKIRAGKEAAFEDVCRALAFETAKESGCRLYAYYRTAEPRTYYCILAFDSYQDFLVHQVSEHHETLITPRAEEFFEGFEAEWLDPVKDASDGPPTNHQQPGSDASDAMRAYADAMPAVVQDWWLPLRR